MLAINQILILIVASVCAVIDMRTAKIFNVITFPTAAIGIIANFVFGGWQAGVMAIAGWLLACFVMIFPDRKKKMAFGDAKLMAAIGAFLGPGGMLLTFFYFSLCYGAVAVVKFCMWFPWKQFFTVFKLLGVENAGMAQDSIDTSNVNQALKSPIPLGPVIAVGMLIGILLEKQTLAFLGFNSTEISGFPMFLRF